MGGRGDRLIAATLPNALDIAAAERRAADRTPVTRKMGGRGDRLIAATLPNALDIAAAERQAADRTPVTTTHPPNAQTVLY